MTRWRIPVGTIAELGGLNKEDPPLLLEFDGDPETGQPAVVWADHPEVEGWTTPSPPNDAIFILLPQSNAAINAVLGRRGIRLDFGDEQAEAFCWMARVARLRRVSGSSLDLDSMDKRVLREAELRYRLPPWDAEPLP